MTGAELKTLRESLGLTVNWLANEAEVRDRSVNYWESGRYSIPDDVKEIMEELSEIFNEGLTATIANIENILSTVDGHKPLEMVLIRYRTDKDLWLFHDDYKKLELPATFHATILAGVRNYFVNNDKINIKIIYMDSESYLAWLKSKKLEDSTAHRSMWASESS